MANPCSVNREARYPFPLSVKNTLQDFQPQLPFHFRFLSMASSCFWRRDNIFVTFYFSKSGLELYSSEQNKGSDEATLWPEDWPEGRLAWLWIIVCMKMKASTGRCENGVTSGLTNLLGVSLKSRSILIQQTGVNLRFGRVLVSLYAGQMRVTVVRRNLFVAVKLEGALNCTYLLGRS